MRVSVKWLSEYLDLSSVSPRDLADEITLTGIEVDDVTIPSETLQKLVVGEVLTAEKMEGSDHLNVTTVNVGEDEATQIVCGAPNVKAGQKVIVALPGARLPGGFKIKKSKLRGHVSNGMICSLDELGFSDSVVPKHAEDGIYILPEDAVVGESVLSYVGLDDAFIELDITPNRADALSMRGVAHETGAILSQKPQFKSIELTEDTNETIENWVKVTVTDGDDTPIYKMRVIKDLTIKESPLWLQNKLMNAGIRPIDAVVDVTNYIMLEYGQPLHAFDYDALDSKDILVRRAHDKETMVTLDGQERQLNPDQLVITNGEIPVALAGVMGGENTHVTTETRTVALESAVFDSTSIRKTAQRLNLRSESSSRFEKGINKATVEEALNHAAALIADLGQGTVVTGVASVTHVEPKSVTVESTIDRINRALGTELIEEDIIQVFKRLGFEAEVSSEQVKVTVPPRRWDIAIEADIIEEIARIYGYNNIPSTLPVNETVPGELTREQSLTRFSRHYMEGAGLSQAISYALTTVPEAKAFSLESGEPIELDWPMSEEHRALRKSLISGLLDNVQYNVARQTKNVGLYEIGHVFHNQPGETMPKEVNHIAGVLTGTIVDNTWQETEQTVDYYAAKGIVEGWLEQIGLGDDTQFKPAQDIKGMHPGRTAYILINNTVVGFVGQLHPSVALERDLQDTVLFELNMDRVFGIEQEPLLYTSIPKYPGTSRDIAFVVDETVLHEEILHVMKEQGGKWLRSIRLFDLYQGEKIEPGKKSVAYSLSYLNPDATLKEEDVNGDFEKLKQALIDSFKAEIR